MKTIKAAWQEKDGHPALAVQFPRMFPFQVEEIEQVASELGFVVDGTGQQRALGSLAGLWSVPGPGALISSSNAVSALRAGLAKLGYAIEFEGVEEQDDGVLGWLKYETADEPSGTSKVIVATWLNEPVGALRLSYPLSLSEAERLLVARLGTIFGFAVENDVWIAPAGGEDIVAWRNELSTVGIEIQFQDSAELIRATHKTLELKSLDPEKVAPFSIDLSKFSEAEKSAIKKAAWECRFHFEGVTMTPPDMNESYLMFRNKVREAGFLLKIVHGDKP